MKVVLVGYRTLPVVVALVPLLWWVDQSLISMQAKRPRLVKQAVLFNRDDLLGDGAALRNTFEAWEWRMFFPRDGDNFHHGKHILRRIISHVEDLAELIGFKYEALETEEERRTDVYLDIGDPSVGLKYRGEEKDGGKESGVLLELKLRKRLAEQNGFFSSRSYVLEDWDKLVRKPFSTSEGIKGVVKVLESALEEYSALKKGSAEERFGFDVHMEELIREARDRAQSPKTFQMVEIDKVRFREKIEFKAKTQTYVFKFEVTSVHIKGHKWWSVAIEGMFASCCEWLFPLSCLTYVPSRKNRLTQSSVLCVCRYCSIY